MVQMEVCFHVTRLTRRNDFNAKPFQNSAICVLAVFLRGPVTGLPIRDCHRGSSCRCADDACASHADDRTDELATGTCGGLCGIDSADCLLAIR